LKKTSKKKMSWCSDAPEDETISLYAGLLVNPDVPLSHWWIAQVELLKFQKRGQFPDETLGIIV
jgi:hypothetical protein